MHEHHSTGLNYIVSEKSSFLVISFSGSLVHKHEDVVKKCQEEIAQRRCDRIVLDLSQVNSVNQAVIPEFVRLQKSARDKGKLRLCGVKGDVRHLLLEKGAIREDELRDSLKTALESLGSASSEG